MVYYSVKKSTRGANVSTLSTVHNYKQTNEQIHWNNHMLLFLLLLKQHSDFVRKKIAHNAKSHLLFFYLFFSNIFNSFDLRPISDLWMCASVRVPVRVCSTDFLSVWWLGREYLNNKMSHQHMIIFFGFGFCRCWLVGCISNIYVSLLFTMFCVFRRLVGCVCEWGC